MKSKLFDLKPFGTIYKLANGRYATLVNRGQYGESVTLYIKERDMEIYGERNFDLEGNFLGDIMCPDSYKVIEEVDPAEYFNLNKTSKPLEINIENCIKDSVFKGLFDLVKRHITSTIYLCPKCGTFIVDGEDCPKCGTSRFETAYFKLNK